MFKHLLLVLIAAGVIVGGPAFAHAKLQSSSPANGAELMATPQTLSLVFNEEVQLASLKLTSAGKQIPVMVDRTAKAAAAVSVKLPALLPGKYDVQWSALSPEDGHTMKGSFVFTIMPIQMKH